MHDQERQDGAHVFDVANADLGFARWQDPVKRLNDALERDELQLIGQPIAALSEIGTFLMAEVLVRLIEEEASHLPPGEFLPVFEQYGMMPALDRWVIERSARLIYENRASGFRRLSVNLASQTLADPEMPKFIAAQFERFSLPKGALCLEIAESDVLGNLEGAARFAAAARAAGCGIAIDGFGYRAVSFAPLKSLRVDFLKVDGCITRNLTRRETALKKMQAIVRVGQAIGFEVIAEFLEDAETVPILRRLGVGYAQGFGVARPAPFTSRDSVF